MVSGDPELREFVPVPLSGADLTGVLFTDGEVMLRGIFGTSVGTVDDLLKSVFWENLSERHIVPCTRVLESDAIPRSMRHFSMVLEHEAIAPVTYPREWSFEMVRKAALAFLDIVELGDATDYTCKDAHLYNWVFRGTCPVWVDIGSLVPRVSEYSVPWLESFSSDVLFPLRLWDGGMASLATRAVGNPAHPVSTDEAIACIHPVLRGNGILARDLRYAYRGFVFANTIPETSGFRRGVKYLFRTKTMDQVRHLRRSVSRLSYDAPTAWGQYHAEFLDETNRIRPDSRFNRIIELLNDYSPSSVLDLAGNAGVLSEEIAVKMPGTHVCCTDYDAKAIDLLFQRQVRHPTPGLVMAVHDFMSPDANPAEISPVLRFMSDCVLALGVSHHLLLTQGYGYDNIFRALRSYSRRLVFVEYMPLGLHDGTRAPPLPEWYTRENFEASFLKFFTVLHTEQLDVNRILYIGQIRPGIEECVP